MLFDHTEAFLIDVQNTVWLIFADYFRHVYAHPRTYALIYMAFFYLALRISKRVEMEEEEEEEIDISDINDFDEISEMVKQARKDNVLVNINTLKNVSQRSIRKNSKIYVADFDKCITYRVVNDEDVDEENQKIFEKLQKVL